MASEAPAPRCPQCGGPVTAIEDDPFLPCGFCGAHLYLDDSAAVRHFLVDPALDRSSAAAALSRWLKDREVVGAPAPSSVVLVFLPFWQVRSRGRDSVVPASGALFEGIDRIEIPAGDQRVFSVERAKGPNGEEARLMEATVPLLAAAARLRLDRRGSRSSFTGVGAEVSDRAMEAAALDGVEARLVHVPLYLIAYLHQGGEYNAAVDACTGRIYPVTAPRSADSRIDLAFSLLLAAGLVLNLGALSLFRDYPPLSIFLLALIAWGFCSAGMRLSRWTES